MEKKFTGGYQVVKFKKWQKAEDLTKLILAYFPGDLLRRSWRCHGNDSFLSAKFIHWISLVAQLLGIEGAIFMEDPPSPISSITDQWHWEKKTFRMAESPSFMAETELGFRKA